MSVACCVHVGEVVVACPNALLGLLWGSRCVYVDGSVGGCVGAWEYNLLCVMRWCECVGCVCVCVGGVGGGVARLDKLV